MSIGPWCLYYTGLQKIEQNMKLWLREWVSLVNLGKFVWHMMGESCEMGDFFFAVHIHHKVVLNITQSGKNTIILEDCAACFIWRVAARWYFTNFV